VSNAKTALEASFIPCYQKNLYMLLGMVLLPSDFNAIPSSSFSAAAELCLVAFYHLKNVLCFDNRISPSFSIACSIHPRRLTASDSLEARFKKAKSSMVTLTFPKSITSFGKKDASNGIELTIKGNFYNNGEDAYYENKQKNLDVLFSFHNHPGDCHLYFSPQASSQKRTLR
jgi:hypothetical protein